MTADLKSLEEIEIRLAELDGRCVHVWQIATVKHSNGLELCVFKCLSCDKVSHDEEVPPHIDNPVCKSLETLADYAVEKRIPTSLHVGGVYITVNIDEWDEYCSTTIVSVLVHLKDYPSPSAAELHTRANAVLQAREAQNNGKDKS